MLQPIEFYKGAKNIHPTALCLCSCGKTRIVRQSRLRRGEVTMCAGCARKQASIRGGATRKMFTDDEMLICNKRSEYKCNAKRRGLVFALTQEDFRLIVSNPCRYCGTANNIGIDRVDNAIGYTLKNSSPCCDRCNFAKRDMTESDFLNLVECIHAYQSR
jgi:hypothetical protein